MVARPDAFGPQPRPSDRPPRTGGAGGATGDGDNGDGGAAALRGSARLRRAVSRTPLVDTAPAMRSLVEQARLELVPMKSLTSAGDALAPGSRVSMTCSPAKSIEVTLAESERLTSQGHDVTPHLAARMVHDDTHLAEIAQRLADAGTDEVFVVAGDAEPSGRFHDAIEFLDAFLALEPTVRRIGFTAYPDGHPAISSSLLHEALHQKQSLILDSGREAFVSTQMCFSADRISDWLRRERSAGLTVPVHLGIAGPLDRAKLMATGIRLGVGSSLRYLSKNRAALGRLMTQRAYLPDHLLRPLAREVDQRGIESLHVFTFNQVEATEAWRSRTLDR